MPERGRAAFGAPAECYSYSYGDPAGDTTGGLDVVAYSLSYDCKRKQWVFRLAAARSFSDDRLAFAGLAFDTDLKRNNNCGGVDREIAVGWAPDERRLVGVVVGFQGSCQRTRYLGSLEFTRSEGPRKLTMRFRDSRLQLAPNDDPLDFDWFAFATGRQEASGRDWDDLPNRGSHVARGTALGDLQRERSGPRSFVPDPSAIAIGDHHASNLADDAVLYRRNGTVHEWRNYSADTWHFSKLDVTDPYTVVESGDYDGNGLDDTLFQEPGTASDVIWYREPDIVEQHPIEINAQFRIGSGDFDGDGFDDLFMFRPGPASDQIRFGRPDRTFDTVSFAIDEVANVSVGDVNGDGRSDALLWSNGERDVLLLRGRVDRSFDAIRLRIGGDYEFAVVGDYDGDRRSDVLFVDEGVGADAMWKGQPVAPFFRRGAAAVLNESAAAIRAGDFNGDGADDIWLEAPGDQPNRYFSGTPRPPVVLASTLPDAAVGVTYSHTLATNSSDAPFHWSLSGAPEGLAIRSDGELWGRPLRAGEFNVRVGVRDRYGNRGIREFPLHVEPMPATATLPFDGVGDVVSDPVNGRIFVSGGPANDDLAVFDADGALLHHFSGLPNATSVAFDADSVFVGLVGPHTILDLNRTTLSLQGAVDTGAGRPPLSIAVAANRVWFSFVGGTQEIASWDPTTGVVATHELSSASFVAIHQLAVHHDDRMPPDELFVHGVTLPCQAARYVVTAGTPVEEQVSTVGWAFCSEVNTSSEGLVVSSSGASVLVFVAGIGDPRLLLYALPSTVIDFDVSSTGHLVAVSANHLGLWSQAGSRTLFLESAPSTLLGVTIGPDENQVFAFVQRDGATQMVRIAIP